MSRSKSEMLLPNERLDDLGINGYMLIQNPEYFCFGMDAVLLSSYARVYKGENVLDLCTGNGILPVLLAAKTGAAHICGLEIQQALADMAKRSVEYNGLSERINIIRGDLKDYQNLIPEKYDCITVNPPYIKAESGLTNANSPINIARHEVESTFEDIIRCAYFALKPKGRIYIVHRPLRLVGVLKAMSNGGIEPKALRFVQPFENKEPNLVLIEGVRDAAEEIRIAPPLIVYDAPGKYTDEVLKIYGYE